MTIHPIAPYFPQNREKHSHPQNEDHSSIISPPFSKCPLLLSYLSLTFFSLFFLPLPTIQLRVIREERRKRGNIN